MDAVDYEKIEYITKTLPAEISNIRTFIDLIDSVMGDKEVPLRITTQVDVALDEILSNICNYAYTGVRGDMSMGYAFVDDPAALVLRFTDRGVEYNPLEKADPDITLSFDEREIGGLGIFLVKNTMDEVTYKYEDGCNILTLYKLIG